VSGNRRSTPRGTGGKPERWVVLPDTHLPFEDKATLRAVESYIADHTWAGWIHLGDLIDFNELSRFEVGNNRLDKVGAIQKSYAATADFLDRHRKLVGPKCRMVYIEGNHEDRITQYLEKNPEGVGMLEVPNALDCKRTSISLACVSCTVASRSADVACSWATACSVTASLTTTSSSFRAVSRRNPDARFRPVTIPLPIMASRIPPAIANISLQASEPIFHHFFTNATMGV